MTLPSRAKRYAHSLFVASTRPDSGRNILVTGLLEVFKQRLTSIGHYTLVHKDILCREPIEKEHHEAHISHIYDAYSHDELLFQDLVQKLTPVLHHYKHVIIEAEGHMGAGSYHSLNNAYIAHQLQIPVVLIATGDKHTCLDDLALNIAFCKAYNTPIRGIIINKVPMDSRTEIESYFSQALHELHLPLLGVIPYCPSLEAPTMKELAQLFQVSILAGAEGQFVPIQGVMCAGESLEAFIQAQLSDQLIVAPATRDDILLACIEKKMREVVLHNRPYFTSLILTGPHKPKGDILQKLEIANIPTIWISQPSFEVISTLSAFTAEVQKGDVEKIHQASRLVQQYVHCDLLLEADRQADPK